MTNALVDLKRKLAALEPSFARQAGRFTLGCPAIDAPLGGGLPRSCLHEVFACQAGDEASGAGFALAIALRAAGEGRSIVWVRNTLAAGEAGEVYAPGLVEFGLDPEAVLLVSVKNERTALRAALEALRSSSPGAVVVDLWGRGRLLDLTASRRMMLAASRSGVTGVLLRAGGAPQPGAALTRWLVAAAPSAGLATDAPSHPAFDITLERHRAGIAGRTWRVEWNRDQKHFNLRPVDSVRHPALPQRLPPVAGLAASAVPGAVVPLSFDGPAASGEEREPYRNTG